MAEKPTIEEAQRLVSFGKLVDQLLNARENGMKLATEALGLQAADVTVEPSVTFTIIGSEDKTLYRLSLTNTADESDEDEGEDN